MERRTAIPGILVCSILLVAAGGAGFFWPVLTCPNCKGAGQFIMVVSPTDTMDGVKPSRMGSKCSLCIGRRRITLGRALKYRITGRAPMEPPYEQYKLDDAGP